MIEEGELYLIDSSAAVYRVLNEQVEIGNLIFKESWHKSLVSLDDLNKLLALKLIVKIPNQKKEL